MSPLKKRRLICGLTQKQLAEALGVHHTLICKWENGKMPDKTEYLVRLNCIFNNEKHPIIIFLEECVTKGIIDVDTQIGLTFEYFRV